MIIKGLEELSEEEVSELDIDFLQDIIYVISMVEPVNKLGNILHISNIDYKGSFSFELDNGKELMMISINSLLSPLLIRIDFDNRAIQYLYDEKKKKIVCKDTFLQNDKMILKYRYTDYKYYFELFIYDPILDLKFEFNSYKYDAEYLVKKLFTNKIDFKEILSIIPKDDLKVTITTEEAEKVMIYKDNELVNEENKIMR